MALVISGPTRIFFPPNTDTFSVDYNSSKPASWFVSVTDDGLLSPSDYSVTISSAGLLTVDLQPGVIVPPNTTLSLIVRASSGPGNGNNASIGVTVRLPAGTVPCFVKGTLIETESGCRAVEELAVGDKVRSSSGELLRIEWIGEKTLQAEALKRNPQLRPVCIQKGAFGKGLPDRDLYVSPQHRIVVEGWRAELLFGEPKVFAAAVHLVNDQTIRQVNTYNPVTYYHIACCRHAILLSNGLPTESLFLGEMAVMSFDREDAEELRVLFPELRNAASAFEQTRVRCLKRPEAAALRDTFAH
ncbi:Hint domain-containing protein [Ruegeria arenilitoris]|uniref:Hint domain-containing protein n=1 Tax=Ruegeria arenilitoris TaxID=1173585 RepID=UPI00147F91D8|nr:Hint domain-containing protein [Ruegeria arenilitoris]